jgi:nucleotide-binding universal stress UspA family protein
MKILIATDGSAYSKAAVEECCKYIAVPASAEIKIISVFEDVYALVGEPAALSAEFYQELSTASRETCLKFTHEAAEAVLQRFGARNVKVSEDVRKGPPDLEIVELAREWGADLIVVGSHGRGFWGRLLGSVSDAVAHHAPCTVMVVRRGENGN